MRITEKLRKLLSKFTPRSAAVLFASPVFVNCLDERKNTPLHIACQEGDWGHVEWLLAQGAKVNLHNENGETPLLIICGDEKKSEREVLQAVSILLEYRADSLATDARQCNALWLALAHGKRVVYQYLQEKVRWELPTLERQFLASTFYFSNRYFLIEADEELILKNALFKIEALYQKSIEAFDPVAQIFLAKKTGKNYLLKRKDSRVIFSDIIMLAFPALFEEEKSNWSEEKWLFLLNEASQNNSKEEEMVLQILLGDFSVKRQAYQRAIACYASAIQLYVSSKPLICIQSNEKSFLPESDLFLLCFNINKAVWHTFNQYRSARQMSTYQFCEEVRVMTDALLAKKRQVERIFLSVESSIVEKDFDIKQVQGTLTEFVFSLLMQFAQSAFFVLGEPPDTYVLVGFGALQRRDVTCHENFRLGVFLKNATENTVDYFQAFFRLLSICLCALSGVLPKTWQLADETLIAKTIHEVPLMDFCFIDGDKAWYEKCKKQRKSGEKKSKKSKIKERFYDILANQENERGRISLKNDFYEFFVEVINLLKIIEKKFFLKLEDFFSEKHTKKIEKADLENIFKLMLHIYTYRLMSQRFYCATKEEVMDINFFTNTQKEREGKLFLLTNQGSENIIRIYERFLRFCQALAQLFFREDAIEEKINRLFSIFCQRLLGRERAEPYIASFVEYKIFYSSDSFFIDEDNNNEAKYVKLLKMLKIVEQHLLILEEEIKKRSVDENRYTVQICLYKINSALSSTQKEIGKGGVMSNADKIGFYRMGARYWRMVKEPIKEKYFLLALTSNLPVSEGDIYFRLAEIEEKDCLNYLQAIQFFNCALVDYVRHMNRTNVILTLTHIAVLCRKIKLKTFSEEIAEKIFSVLDKYTGDAEKFSYIYLLLFKHKLIPFKESHRITNHLNCASRLVMRQLSKKYKVHYVDSLLYFIKELFLQKEFSHAAEILTHFFALMIRYQCKNEIFHGELEDAFLSLVETFSALGEEFSEGKKNDIAAEVFFNNASYFLSNFLDVSDALYDAGKVEVAKKIYKKIFLFSKKDFSFTARFVNFSLRVKEQEDKNEMFLYFPSMEAPCQDIIKSGAYSKDTDAVSFVLRHLLNQAVCYQSKDKFSSKTAEEEILNVIKMFFSLGGVFLEKGDFPKEIFLKSTERFLSLFLDVADTLQILQKTEAAAEIYEIVFRFLGEGFVLATRCANFFLKIGNQEKAEEALVHCVNVGEFEVPASSDLLNPVSFSATILCPDMLHSAMTQKKIAIRFFDMGYYLYLCQGLKHCPSGYELFLNELIARYINVAMHISHAELFVQQLIQKRDVFNKEKGFSLINNQISNEKYCYGKEEEAEESNTIKSDEEDNFYGKEEETTEASTINKNDGEECFREEKAILFDFLPHFFESLTWLSDLNNVCDMNINSTLKMLFGVNKILHDFYEQFRLEKADEELSDTMETFLKKMDSEAAVEKQKEIKRQTSYFEMLYFDLVLNIFKISGFDEVFLGQFLRKMKYSFSMGTKFFYFVQKKWNSFFDENKENLELSMNDNFHALFSTLNTASRESVEICLFFCALLEHSTYLLTLFSSVREEKKLSSTASLEMCLAYYLLIPEAACFPTKPAKQKLHKTLEKLKKETDHFFLSFRRVVTPVKEVECLFQLFVFLRIQEASSVNAWRWHEIWIDAIGATHAREIMAFYRENLSIAVLMLQALLDVGQYREASVFQAQLLAICYNLRELFPRDGVVVEVIEKICTLRDTHLEVVKATVQTVRQSVLALEGTDIFPNLGAFDFQVEQKDFDITANTAAKYFFKQGVLATLCYPLKYLYLDTNNNLPLKVTRVLLRECDPNFLYEKKKNYLKLSDFKLLFKPSSQFSIFSQLDKMPVARKGFIFVEPQGGRLPALLTIWRKSEKDFQAIFLCADDCQEEGPLERILLEKSLPMTTYRYAVGSEMVPVFLYYAALILLEPWHAEAFNTTTLKSVFDLFQLMREPMVYRAHYTKQVVMSKSLEGLYPLRIIAPALDVLTPAVTIDKQPIAIETLFKRDQISFFFHQRQQTNAINVGKTEAQEGDPYFRLDESVYL